MKTRNSIFALFFCWLINEPLFAQCSWSQMGNYTGIARIDAVAFSINSKGYIGTGYDGTDFLKDFWEYDPLTDTWSQKADFGGTARHGAVGFSINNKGYVGTGKTALLSNSVTNDFWEYDPVLNNWIQKANFGGVARSEAVGISIGGKGYIGTGYDQNFNYMKDFWEYDPNLNSWAQKANFGGASRRSAVGFSTTNYGYLGTGTDSVNARNSDFWEYNPASNNWLKRADMPGSASNASVFSISNHGYIVGGTNAIGNGFYYEFNPSQNVWNIGAVPSNNTHIGNNAVGFTIGSKGYIATGGYSYSQDVYEYNPSLEIRFTGFNNNDATCLGVSNGSSTAVFTGGTPPYVFEWYNLQNNSWNLITNQNQQTAIGLSEGYYLVHVVDDNNCVSLNYSTEINTKSGRLKKKNDTPFSARQNAVAFSIGSKGYFGTGENNGFLKDFWEYDSITSTWSQIADFIAERSKAVGFSIGLKGYVGTGYDLNFTYKKDFWEYDPNQNLWTQKANFGGSARIDAVGFNVGTKGYIGTGYDINGLNKKDIWEYDPVLNSWIQKANFGGTARSAAVGFSIGTKGYLGAGNDGSYKKDFWEFDPSLNLWTSKNDVNFIVPNIGEAIGFSIGNKGYIGVNNFQLYEFDPTLNKWKLMVSHYFSEFGGFASGACFTVGSRGYMLSSTRDFWEYNQSFTINPNFSILDESCSNNSNGSILANPSGGKSPYSYSWLTTPSQNSASINSLSSGDYNLIITDDDGCVSDQLTASVNVSNGPWKRKADFNGEGRYGAVAFSIGTKGYYGTGSTNIQNFNDFWEYDPISDTWSQKANFSGVARGNAVGFSIGSKGYIGTGFDNNNSINLDDFWEYNPVSNTWTQKSNFGGAARYNAIGISIGSKGYIGTGQSGSNTYYKDFWEYEPNTNQWIQKNDFGGTARYSAVAFSIGSKGYVGTGYNNNYANDFWEYDQLTNSFKKVADYPDYSLSDATAFKIGNKGYIGTGSGQGGSNGVFWEYDNISNKWTKLLKFAGGVRSDASSFSIGSKAYVIGGNGKTDLWEFDPTQEARLNLAQIPCSDTLLASVTGSIAPYTYNWSNGAGNVSQQIGLTPGYYDVTVTDSNTCKYTSPTLNYIGKFLLSIGSVQNTNCGANTGSANTNVYGSTWPVHYQWSRSNIDTLYYIINLAAGTYTVTATDTLGCFATDSVTIATIAPSFGVAFAANPQSGTIPLNVVFTNSNPNLSNYNFEWNFGDGSIVNSNNSTIIHQYTTAGYFNVKLIATSIATGCTDSLLKLNYINATGGAGCTHTASVFPSGTASACIGDTIVLSCNTDTSFSYQWNLNSVPISGKTDSTLAITVNGAYSVTITKAGCPVTSASTQVTFNPLPAQPIISVVGSIIPCIGSSATLVASGNSNFNYLWNTADTTKTIVVNNSGFFTVRITDPASGCYSTSNLFSLNVSLAPAVPVCLVTVDTLSTHNFLLWNNPHSLSIDSIRIYRETTTNVYTHIASVAGDSLSEYKDFGANPNSTSYKYKLASLDTCGIESYLSDFHNTIHLQYLGGGNLQWTLYDIENQPNPVIFYVVERDDNNTGNFLPISTTIPGGNTTYSDVNHTLFPNARYRVSVTWNISCNSTMRIQTGLNVTRSNIKNKIPGNLSGLILSDMIIKIIPNPASQNVIFVIPSGINFNSLQIIDNLGRTLIEKSIEKSKSSNLQIDLSQILPGSYTVSFKSENVLINKKLIITR